MKFLHLINRFFSVRYVGYFMKDKVGNYSSGVTNIVLGAVCCVSNLVINQWGEFIRY